MYYEHLFEKIGFWDVGRESFFAIDKKLNSSPALKKLKENVILSFDSGDAVFGENVAQLAKEADVAEEVMTLYIYIVMSQSTLENYRRLGIDESVFYQTMADLAIDSRYYYEKTGIYGISISPHRPWLRLHMTNKIYRFGRLQFELIESAFNTIIDGYEIKKGDLCLTTHIPRYAPLDIAQCEESYCMARNFFKKHYGIDRCVFFCDSWTLHPWITECMPADSRLVQFGKKYKLVQVTEDIQTVINYVFFPHNFENPQDYPDDTSLQKAAKKRLIEKLPLGTAIGVRL